MSAPRTPRDAQDLLRQAVQAQDLHRRLFNDALTEVQREVAGGKIDTKVAAAALWGLASRLRGAARAMYPSIVESQDTMDRFEDEMAASARVALEDVRRSRR